MLNNKPSGVRTVYRKLLLSDCIIDWSSVLSSSDTFRKGRMLDLDRFPTDIGQPVWEGRERPPDAIAYRLRQCLQYLSENHRDILERKYFLQQSVEEIARLKGCTPRAVRGMVERAKNNLLKAIAEHGHEYLDVPKEEL